MIPQLVVLSSKDKQDVYIAELSKRLSLSPYDIYQIAPENDKSGIGIDQIRILSEILLTQTGSQRIIVLTSFETASMETQNALLKILEEKTLQNIFILFTNTVERVIPTIRSRVQTVILDKKNKNLDAQTISNFRHLLDLLKKQNTHTFLSLDMFCLKTKEDTIAFIDDLIIFLSELLKGTSASNISLIINKAMQIKNNIFSLNINHQLALDNLLIFAHKTVTMKLN